MKVLNACCSEAEILFHQGCMIQIRKRYRVKLSLVMHSLHERAKLDENNTVDFLIKSGNLVIFGFGFDNLIYFLLTKPLKIYTG